MAKWCVLVFSYIFYAVLSAKEFTWIFISSDSGDWLAGATWWFVVQPVGSPLYILLGHFLNALPGDLVLKMTLILSCACSAVTVMFVYLIVQKLSTRLVAVACSLLLLGSAVFLTQSTVLEEYAITTMFMTGAFWFYLCGKKKLVGLFLGLAIAVHIFALIFALLWFAILWREWRQWWKAYVITAVAGCGPYILIPILMYFDTPRLLAGDLSISSLKMYLFDISNGIIGTMSVFEAPKRFFMTGIILLTSFSVGLVFAVRGVKPLDKTKLLLLSNIIFILWYILTTVDPITWTYITFISPAIVILCGIGLVKYKRWAVCAVLITSVVLAGLNATYLNANKLTQENPLAVEYYNELVALPDNSVVVVTPGAYSLGLFYAMSDGKKLVPISYPYIEEWKFVDYYEWLKRTYPNTREDTLSTIKNNLGNTYLVQTPEIIEDWNGLFVLDDVSANIKRVIEVK